MKVGLPRTPASSRSASASEPAPAASPAPPLAARFLADELAAAALARHRSAPAVQGRMARPRARARPRLRPAAATPHPSPPVAHAAAAVIAASPAGSGPACPSVASTVDSVLQALRVSMRAPCAAAPVASDGAVSRSPRPRHRFGMAAAPPTGSHPLDGLLCDPALLVKGLGSLSLLSVALGGPAKVPLLAGGAMPALGSLWVASLDSDEDDDDEELAPRSPLASSEGVVSG
nr:uncharacterized protein LOC127303486 [Lolium perenne]